jgi:hypothetical protein
MLLLNEIGVDFGVDFVYHSTWVMIVVGLLRGAQSLVGNHYPISSSYCQLSINNCTKHGCHDLTYDGCDVAVLTS